MTPVSRIERANGASKARLSPMATEAIFSHLILIFSLTAGARSDAMAAIISFIYLRWCTKDLLLFVTRCFLVLQFLFYLIVTPFEVDTSIHLEALEHERINPCQRVQF